MSFPFAHFEPQCLFMAARAEFRVSLLASKDAGEKPKAAR
jgi:hypothetical protein